MGKRSILLLLLITCILSFGGLSAQDRVITVPKSVPGAPFKVNDSEDLFGKAYRWFVEGEVEFAADSLRKLINLSGHQLDESNYYLVVANFGDHMSPLGMLHEGSAFLDTRLYGLQSDRLFYVFISKSENAPSFVSTLLTRKSSPFEENLLDFLSLFFQLPIPTISTTGGDVWIDIKEYDIPEDFEKNCDISIIVKKDLSDEGNLASAIFDNTAKEHWSFGIATAVTTLNDVDIILDVDRIVIRPKPDGDLAAFGVINYHFGAVDTKAPTLATSFHLLAGLRLADHIEPLVGLGFGFPTFLPIEVHVFGGASFEFANKLKSGFAIGDVVNQEVDPFDTDIRVLPRFGIELKFP